MRVSVITLTHNKLAYTQRCLTSWLQTAYPAWEIVVVDNGSSDGTVEWLQTFAGQAKDVGVRVRVVRNTCNVGCSTARNMGIEAASGEGLVFVDNDVALRSRGWLTRLGRHIESDLRCGVVGPKMVYPYPPHDIQCAGVAVSRSGRVQFRGRGEPRDAPAFNHGVEVPCLISACFMFSRRLVEEIGGLDEAFNPVEYEDLDFCYRARSRGFRVLYEPSVEMYHFEGVTTTGTPALPNTYLIVKNGLLFKRRWRAMFEQEDGPPDSETRWKAIPPRRLDEIGDLPVVN